jgi:hypothetical protein
LESSFDFLTLAAALFRALALPFAILLCQDCQFSAISCCCSPKGASRSRRCKTNVIASYLVNEVLRSATVLAKV